MDFITTLVFGIIGLTLFAVIITRIIKAVIENKAILRDIDDAIMDFDKIDALKKRGFSLKYFAKLQEAEQKTIEAKLITSESIDELFFLYERAQSLTSKSFRKKIEDVLVQYISVKLKLLAPLPAPDQTGQILKEIYGYERALKNITAPDLEKQIYALKKAHTIVSETMKASLEKLAETN